MDQIIFTLFVAGDGELTVRARLNFERLVQARLSDRCSLRVVDVLKEPGIARQYRIIATPMLVREQPSPVIRILGDLSHEAKLLAMLGLEEKASNPETEANGPTDGTGTAS